MTNLPANPKSEWTPLLAEQEERYNHREWIGGRALTLLNHYWRDDDPVELTAAIGADWADVLEGLPREYLQWACVQYQRDEPRRKPTPGAIYKLARGRMPKTRLVVDPEPEREPPATAEQAQAICEEYGYSPKRFGGNDGNVG
jgi:hypothetical protein